MKLFEIIPKSLFSVLTSSNRFVYIDVLFLLLKGTELGNLSRSDFVEMLLAEMANQLTTFDSSADDDSDNDQPEALDARAYAQFILRKLNRSGWIRLETDPETLEETIRLPYYATPILTVLKEIEDDEIKEYASNIYGSYAALNDANQKNPENMFTALTIVERNMRQLRRELDMLDGRVYALYQQLIDEVRINSILAQHFDEYQRELQQKLIHPLMTFDSVARFKTPIHDILQNWQEDESKFSLLREQAEDSHRFQTSEEARDSVAEKLVAIQDLYPRLEELVRHIGIRAHTYTARTREKIAYYLNADQSVYSDMIRVMDVLSHCDVENQAKLVSLAAARFPLTVGCFVDNRSLFRSNKASREREIPTPIRELLGEDAPLNEFLREANRHLTEKQIREYVMGQLEDRSIIASREMRLDQFEDFECMLIGAIRVDDARSPYDVKYEDTDYECERYRIPDMYFFRKDES